MFRKLPTLTLMLLLLTTAAMAQRTAPPSKGELAQITERGREKSRAEKDLADQRTRETCASTNGDSEK